MTELRKIRITDVRTVGVPVTDQDRAVEFYGGLGFETRLDVPLGDGGRWIELAPPGVPPMFAFRDPDGNGLEIVEGA
jgi:catechol 2,3-dioxygenase-like lactoylglutathione lyase family enzyme